MKYMTHGKRFLSNSNNKQIYNVNILGISLFVKKESISLSVNIKT